MIEVSTAEVAGLLLRDGLALRGFLSPRCPGEKPLILPVDGLTFRLRSMEGEKRTGPSPGNRDGFFEATRWSVVSRAKDQSSTALASLFEQYRRPLLVFLLSRGHNPDDAEDFVQGFCNHLLSRDFLARVEPEKGRFRTFLLTALQNYIRDEVSRVNAGKRGGGLPPVPLDETGEESEPIHSLASPQAAPDREYDKAWARMVLDHALERMQEECVHGGHGALWQALEPALYDDAEASRYGAIAERLGTTEGAVKVAAHRIRARLRRLIRDEVLQTVTSPEDLEEELAYLVRLFEAG